MNAIPFIPGSLVAFYARDSGGDRQDASVDQQIDSFLRWCREHSLIPGQIFKDQARPGSTVIGRSAFHDAIYHFRSGQAPEAGLVIWSFSRFARDFDDAQFYRADLRRRGYIFHSLNDQVPEGSIGRFFEAAIDWKNQQFLEDLSRDVKRGLYDLVQNKGGMPGIPPRGFVRRPLELGIRRDGKPHIVHRWVPDPDLIPLVQQAFSMRAAGASLAHIHATTHLYAGINCYTTFFTNRIYIGELHFGDLVIPDYCDPIIDRPTWDAVQAQITKHQIRNRPKNPSSHPRRHNSKYLLSGLAYCSMCGSPLYGLTSKKSTGQTYERYACTRARRRRDCAAQPIPRKLLEQAVISTLHDYILQPELIQSQQDLARDSRAERLQELDAQRRVLSQRLGTTRRHLTNIIAAIAEKKHSRSLLDKLESLEAEEGDLLAQISRLDQETSTPLPDLSTLEISAYSSHVRARLESMDITELREVLHGLVHRIDVERDGRLIRGLITCYLPPPPI